MTPTTLDEFVDCLLSKDCALDDIDPEVRQQLKVDYVQHLNGEIIRALLSALPESKLIEFERLVETSTDTQLQGWLEQHVPNTKEIIAGVMVEFESGLRADADPKPMRGLLRWVRRLFWGPARPTGREAAR